MILNVTQEEYNEYFKKLWEDLFPVFEDKLCTPVIYGTAGEFNCSTELLDIFNQHSDGVVPDKSKK